MFRSATFKLAWWYVLLATCLSLLFSVVVYHLSTDEISEALHHQYNSFRDNDHDTDNAPPPDTDIRQRGRHLLSELVWFNAVVIVGSSVAGYFLARRTLEPIEVAHQAQVRFTADASHELRTPLAAMRADTEVTLMEKELPTKTKRMLEDNLRDIERLERLTSHLLDIARYQDKANPKMMLLNFDEIVRDALDQLKVAAKRKHIRFEQDIQPVQIVGEQHGLQQLTTIVLDNAVKYSHRDGTVTVTLRSDKAGAVLVIKDSGIGIPADDLPHIFERFYRSANTKSDQEANHGYGLGLPLSQEIVYAHKGTIYIQSREGEGTEVCITLPTTHTV